MNVRNMSECEMALHAPITIRSKIHDSSKKTRQPFVWKSFKIRTPEEVKAGRK